MMEPEPEQNSNETGREVPVVLPREAAWQFRIALHELANVFTGVLVTGGLLQCQPAKRREREYAQRLCALAERGATVVREMRAVLLRQMDEESGPTEENLDSSEGINHV